MMCDKVWGHCSDIEILISSRGDFRGAIIGVLGPAIYIYVYIGLGAQSEDMK